MRYINLRLLTYLLTYLQVTTVIRLRYTLKLIFHTNQGWAQGSFVEAEAEVEAERSRQRRGKAAMSLTEARQGRGRGRELEAETRQTKFEARPRQGDPLKKPSFP